MYTGEIGASDKARRELVVKRKKHHGILEMRSHAAASSDNGPFSKDMCSMHMCTDMTKEESCKNIQGGGCEWHPYNWSKKFINGQFNIRTFFSTVFPQSEFMLFWGGRFSHSPP